MNLKIFFLTSTIVTNIYAGTIQNGTFVGKGLWKSNADQGTYEVTTNVNSNIIDSSYLHQGGKPKKWSFEMEQTKNGFFKVKAYGAEIGKGYCLDKVELCHYEIAVGQLVLEETLTIQGNKLYRFGSKDEGSGRIFWQEALDKN